MYKCEDIREVWDYRLSSAVPHMDRRGGTWLVVVCAKTGGELEVFDTGLPVEDGDINDKQKLNVCYEWLRSVRHKYALPNIKQMKPLVKIINQANDELATLGAV